MMAQAPQLDEKPKPSVQESQNDKNVDTANTNASGMLMIFIF